jgi:TPR repeat protein
MYEQGRGVPLDYVSAYSWYSVASAASERQSGARMKALARIMLTEQLRLAKARAVKWQAEHGKTAEVRSQPTSLMSLIPQK